ncbi:unnamed protein product, partial [Coregonus sp. 'balchen']
DSTEVLGYVLGLLFFVIAWTSKFRAFSRAVRVQCSLASALYSSAILLHDTQYEFVLRAMPWLLASTCCAALDLAVVFLSWCRKGTTQQQPGRGSPDTLGLDGSPLRVPSNKKNLNKMADMRYYMDVNIQPVRNVRVCLKEVTLSREAGVSESHPLRRTMRGVRVDEPCTSETFSDSSSLNSDLEWDFEEANAQWNKLPKEQEKVYQFPLQEWPKNPSPKPNSVCICGIIGQTVKTISSRVGDWSGMIISNT